MKQFRILTLLVLLMTAATGAWAQTSDKETPLTLQATADGWISISKPKANMKYKVGDDGQMQTVTRTDRVTIDVIAGQTVQFFGNGTSITAYGVEQGYGTRFGSSVKCYIYGNIMSLVDELDFAKATELTGDYAFKLLFSYFSNLSNHPTRKLVLPAMTMTKRCYYGMFMGCTSLTAAPALPAQTLAEGCYENMFDDCSSLTAAPELPATTLKEDCYYSMFSKCTSLTTAPLLPAPTLAQQCYNWMFNGCTNLNAVTCLATNISAQGATSNWLKDVAATGTLTIAKGMEDNWTANSAHGIPSGWTTDLYGYKVKLADGTADAGNWSATVNGEGDAQPLPVGGLSEKDAVTMTYGGRLKVKNVTATTDAGPVWDGDLSKLTAESTAEFATATDGMTIKGTLAANVKVSIAAGATVTLDGVNINGANNDSYSWAGLNCLGDATIILADNSTNTVRGFYLYYPGIHVPAGSRLTITGGTEGNGILTAISNGYGAGIGGGYEIHCGNIDIQGGNIRATGVINAAGIGGGHDAICGNITISGGIVRAMGGAYAAGIGSGPDGHCGNIMITNDVTRVIATKSGEDAPYSIGAGYGGTCGTVTIGGTVYWQDNAALNDGATYLGQSRLVYMPSN